MNSLFRKHFKYLIASGAALAFTCDYSPSIAQQSSIQFVTEAVDPKESESADLPPIVSIPEKLQAELTSESTSLDHEVVRERHKSGRVKTEREVVLNEDGDFVNDGQFKQWNEKGELVASGTYAKGKREGVWIQIVWAGDAKLLQSLPYNKFKAPFHSVAEFKEDEMNGFWIITDADNREVSQIELSNGIRSGQATWKFPDGKALYEAYYTDGVLNGLYIERDSDGKVVRQQDYLEGRRVDIKRDFYPDKKVKSEIQILTNKPRIATKDDFLSLSLATYAIDDGATPNGPFVQFFANGAVRARGSYVNGELDGKYETWHENGEKECVGAYANGQRVDSWVWRHANGMRRLTGAFKDGVLEGQLAAWNEQGRSVTPPSSVDSEAIPSRMASESGVSRR
ncbi:MAG: hypothetical protein ABL921_18015 [Pirellula sp.]